MADIIQVLPDSVANQIAAGEVIQRPASVIKELVENSIDAGATSIEINIKDAGRTLIQITDNGCGMSDTDARLSFERHATSKIRTAEDIFSIKTMGFRGEALASVAAIAQVECKTKRPENELGTHIIINGSEIEKQESISCKSGTNFIIKNLFYNIPARRKFLKSNNVEFGHIIGEFNRIALANPDVEFALHHNDKLVISLPTCTLKQRIVNLFGNTASKQLLPVETFTSIVKIHGFTGTPEMAKKKNNDQYFFVNDRFFRHKSFYAAVMRAYENLIQTGYYPSFFIFLDINPADIDVNIHPTKTEIKFTDEYQIAQILEASIREALGKHNIVPSIDFSDTTDYNDMFRPVDGEIKAPSIDVDFNYNPFEKKTVTIPSGSGSFSTKRQFDSGNEDNWEKIFENFNSQKLPQQREMQFETIQSSLNSNESDREEKITATDSGRFMQLKGRYILTTVKSGLMIIDQKRAHERILYEEFQSLLTDQKIATQTSLFPKTLQVSPEEHEILVELLEELNLLGYDIAEFGNNTFIINGTPSDLKTSDVESLIHSFIQQFRDNDENLKIDRKDNLARSLAKSMAIDYNKILSIEEMKKLTDQLFACSHPNLSADGKKCIEIMSIDDIIKRF